MPDFEQLRRDLAHAKINLRSIKDDYEQTKAQREHLIIAGMNGTLCKNAEERERNLTIALSNDVEYQRALDQLRLAEADVDLIDARLETALDERREREWKIRARLSMPCSAGCSRTTAISPATAPSTTAPTRWPGGNIWASMTASATPTKILSSEVLRWATATCCTLSARSRRAATPVSIISGTPASGCGIG